MSTLNVEQIPAKEDEMKRNLLDKIFTGIACTFLQLGQVNMA
jgi:hypothetical protein